VLIALVLAEVVLRAVGQAPFAVNPERAKFWLHDETLGWRHRPSQSGVFRKDPFEIQVDINSFGLRDDEFPREKPEGRQRIVVLGDSFAWGFGVEQPDIFTELLEESLDGVDVINAGVSGYASDQQLLWLQSDGMRFSPDLVVLVFTGNDEHDNAQHLVYGIYHKPKFVLQDGELTLTNVPVPRASLPRRTIYWLGQRTALFGLIGKVRYTLIGAVRNRINQETAAREAASGEERAKVSVRPAEERFAVTLAILDEMQRTAAAGGARFAIMIHGHGWVAGYHGRYWEMVETLKELGYDPFVLEECEEYDQKGMMIPKDGHWNETGHRLVAKELERVISGRELLEPQ
jgi:lysophospholipase L1-like esterase